MRLFKSLILIIICVSVLAGCTAEHFNAYQHATMLMTITTLSEYEYAKDYILKHTSENIQADIDNMLSGDIIDENYSIVEKGRYAEEREDSIFLILEYVINSSTGRFNQITYFEYVDDVLQYYRTYRVPIDEFV